MKSKIFWSARFSLLLVLPLLAPLLGGCSGPDMTKVMAPPGPEINPNEPKVARLHIGDTVTITFSGLPDEITPLEKPIKEDGTITLPDIGRIMAAGKTPGELEDAIHDLYVPQIYTHLNVTVKTSSDRVYYVRGEVRSPGRMMYTGTITVSKAITSAGDFTEFASKGSVWLIRASGDRYKLNLNRILDGKDPDPPVYPGDQIEVERRIF